MQRTELSAGQNPPRSFCFSAKLDGEITAMDGEKSQFKRNRVRSRGKDPNSFVRAMYR